jgi:hypothetical protein
LAASNKLANIVADVLTNWVFARSIAADALRADCRKAPITKGVDHVVHVECFLVLPVINGNLALLLESETLPTDVANGRYVTAMKSMSMLGFKPRYMRTVLTGINRLRCQRRKCIIQQTKRVL